MFKKFVKTDKNKDQLMKYIKDSHTDVDALRVALVDRRSSAKESVSAFFRSCELVSTNNIQNFNVVQMNSVGLVISGKSSLFTLMYFIKRKDKFYAIDENDDSVCEIL